FLRILCRDSAADSRRNACFGRRVSVHRAIGVVANEVKRRNIEATALSRERQQQFLFRIVCEDCVDKFWSEDFTLADTNDVRELGNRFRIKERSRAAHYD